MHAAGAVATKVVPFALLPLARGRRAATVALVGIGATQLVTDVVFSTRQSDWKSFRREMRVARRLAEETA